MDSRVWRQMSHVDSRDRHRFHSESSQVDLTLRLGFPNDEDLKPPQSDNNKPFSAALHHNANHHARQTHQVMVNNGDQSEPSYNPCQILWSKELKTYVLKSNHFGQLQNSSFSHQAKGIGSTANNSPSVPPQKNNDLYTLLSPTSRRAEDQEAEASSGARRKGMRRRRVSNGNDAERRCTNYNCNTNFTPMWRKGPLGPKSLCNACGIRYRKETMNREATAAENS